MLQTAFKWPLKDFVYTVILANLGRWRHRTQLAVTVGVRYGDAKGLNSLELLYILYILYL